MKVEWIGIELGMDGAVSWQAEGMEKTETVRIAVATRFDDVGCEYRASLSDGRREPSRSYGGSLVIRESVRQ